MTGSIYFIWTLLVFDIGQHVGGTDVVDGSLDEWGKAIDVWRQSIELPEMSINNAWMVVKSNSSQPLSYWWQHGECMGCDLLPQASLDPFANYSSLLPAAYTQRLQVQHEGDNTVLCSTARSLRERGEYWLVVTADNTCVLVLANTPPNVYLPLLWTALVYLALGLLYLLVKCMCKQSTIEKLRPGHGSVDLVEKPNTEDNLEMKGKISFISTDSTNDLIITQTKSKPEPSKEPQRTRLRSLDALRGFSLFFMVFVNYGGGSYYFTAHAIWDGGMYFADYFFPWFVFIMGTSLAFAMSSMKKREVPTKWILWKIFTRTFWLLAINIFLKQSLDLRTLPVTGVLARLGVCYAVTALTHLPAASARPATHGHLLRDVTPYAGEWAVMLAITALHLGLTYALPVPGCPTGYIGPGGLHDGGQYYNCTGGAAVYIDYLILGADHILSTAPTWPPIKPLYQLTGPVIDAEGILSTLPAIVTCFLGLQSGKIILHYKEHSSRVIRWVVWGIVCIVMALALCQGDIYGGWMPLNKYLWSESYGLMMSGLAFLLLAGLYLVIDVAGVWRGAPFVYLGMNSIVVYMCHSIFRGYLPVVWVMGDQTLHWPHVFFAFWGASVWTVVAYILYRKRIFVAL